MIEWREKFIDCPVCGTLYLYTYDCGFGENDITLRRATPTEAGRETNLDDCEKDLESGDDETRGYAAQCLTEYYLEKRDDAEAVKLLMHPDEVIRASAEASQQFHLYRREFNNS